MASGFERFKASLERLIFAGLKPDAPATPKKSKIEALKQTAEDLVSRGLKPDDKPLPGPMTLTKKLGITLGVLLLGVFLYLLVTVLNRPAQQAEKDAPPDRMISDGWWYWMHRTEPWPVLLGSALVGEGAKRLPEVREAQIRALDETRELYEELGIKNIQRAMQRQIEHSPIGADDDHVVFGENMTREHVNTPELQDALRKVFTLRLHQTRGRANT